MRQVNLRPEISFLVCTFQPRGINANGSITVTICDGLGGLEVFILVIYSAAYAGKEQSVFISSALNFYDHLL